jgi:hypothetical protein
MLWVMDRFENARIKPSNLPNHQTFPTIKPANLPNPSKNGFKHGRVFRLCRAPTRVPTVQKAKIVGNDVGLLLPIKIQQTATGRSCAPDGLNAPVIVCLRGALCVQSAWNIHRTEALVLPDMRQFVDKMRFGQGAPTIDAVEPHISKMVLPATHIRAFVNSNFSIINRISEYAAGQIEFAVVQRAGIEFYEPVEKKQHFGNVKTIDQQEQSLQETPCAPGGISRPLGPQRIWPALQMPNQSNSSFHFKTCFLTFSHPSHPSHPLSPLSPSLTPLTFSHPSHPSHLLSPLSPSLTLSLSLTLSHLKCIAFTGSTFDTMNEGMSRKTKVTIRVPIFKVKTDNHSIFTGAYAR